MATAIDNYEDEETADPSTSYDRFYKPSYVLIAIDTAPSMFTKFFDDEGVETTPFKLALEACYEIADSLLMIKNQRSWSPFGIVLANNETDTSTFTNFESSMVDTIKCLKEKQDLTNEELADRYQRKGGNLDLSAFLMICRKKFREIKTDIYKRTLIYITNDDDPIMGDTNLRFSSLNEAKNLDPSEIEFQLITTNRDFNYTTYYNEFFSLLKKTPIEQVVLDKIGLVEKLSSVMLKRVTQRKLKFYPWHNEPLKYLKVVLKGVISKPRLYTQKMTAEGSAVKKVKISEVTSVFNHYLKQDPSITFTQEEVDQIKTNNLPIGLTLSHVSERVTDLGFTLLRPVILEVDPKEDLPYFKDFWQYCHTKNKVLVCVNKLKMNDKIRFVELIPKHANNQKIFIVKHIPYNCEISPLCINQLENIKREEDGEHSREKLEVVNELIEKLTANYYQKMFINLEYAKKKAFIRAKLLGEVEEDVVDPTADSVGAADKMVAEIEEKFNRVFGIDLEESKGATKRKAPAGSRAWAKKTK